MFLRVDILKLGLNVSESILEKTQKNDHFRINVMRKIKVIDSASVMYSTKDDDESVLNQAALYVLQNEETNYM